MDGLVIGLALCDSYTQVNCGGQEKVWAFPTVICRKKNEDMWFVGEEAYGFTLTGEGVIVDKLLNLARKNGTATIGDIKFTGQELLERFIEQAIALPAEAYGTEQIRQMVVALPNVDNRTMDCLLYCADHLKIPRSHFHVISYSESFLYYVLSQEQNIWKNQVGLFDLSQKGLRYYEMKVVKGLRQTLVLSDYENLDEGVDLDVLETQAGARLADRILCACGERLLAKKTFSAIFLTGRGFEKPEWASDFTKLAARRRRVFSEPYIFAMGAACKAMDHLAKETAFPFVLICEGRLKATISMEVVHEEKTTQLVIAASGDSWYEAKSTMEFILDHQDELIFQIQPVDQKKKSEVKIPLKGFPERPERTTRIQLKTGFKNENTMAVVIKDKGFGELFPASDTEIGREIVL